MLNQLLALDFLSDWDWNSCLYLLEMLILLLAARWAYHWASPYSLSEELTQKDNQSIAVSFAGYVIAAGLVLTESLASEHAVGRLHGYELAYDLLEILIWGTLSILFLLGARFITNKLLLPKFDTRKELVRDQNVGTGAVEAGMFVGTALILRASVSGESTQLFTDILLALLYFVIGQILLIAFGWLYQKSIGYDLHDEIEKDNEAAGIAFGGNLIAMGMALGHYIRSDDSLIGLVIWFALACFLLFAMRYFTDKLILPNERIDDEIQKDRNWGAALLEGALALILVFFINAAVG